MFSSFWDAASNASVKAEVKTSTVVSNAYSTANTYITHIWDLTPPHPLGQCVCFKIVSSFKVQKLCTITAPQQL